MLTSRLLVLIATIAVGIQDRPPTAPPGPWQSDYKIVGQPSFVKGISAVASLVFAYSGTPGESTFIFALSGTCRASWHARDFDIIKYTSTISVSHQLILAIQDSSTSQRR